MRALLIAVLALVACNGTRPQCHELVTDALAVTCEADQVPRVTVHGRLTVVDCVAKESR